MYQERHSVVATFENRADAEKAVGDLRAAGFAGSDIGYAFHGDEEDMRTYGDHDRVVVDRGPGGAEGAMTGAVTGAAVAGAAIAGLIPGVGVVLAGGILAGAIGGAAVGAVTGGIAGALIDLGVPEEDAGYYEGEFKSGRTIVTVNAGNRYDDAIRILDLYGGESERR